MSGVIATPTKTPKRRSKPTKTGPTVSDLIVKVVSASKSRSGVSLAALKKTLAAGGYDVTKNNTRIKIGVRRLVANGALLQPKGASGSFKINKKQPAAKKKVVKKKKVKSPRMKAKRGSPKKAAGANKSPAWKKLKATSPKKAKKPVTAKKPETARLSVAMSTRAKAQKK